MYSFPTYNVDKEIVLVASDKYFLNINDKFDNHFKLDYNGNSG